VVGIDGSDGAMVALDWAVAEAQRRSARLRLLSSYAVPYYGDPGMAGAYGIEAQVEAIQGEHEGFVTEARQRATQMAPQVVVESVVTLSSAAAALVDSALDGDVVVVGSSGRSGAVADVIGSVATSVCHRAHVPVVVVPTSWTSKGTAMHKIVVGVDGSPAAHAALRWAHEEARLAGATLVVVHAWHYPYSSARGSASETREAMRLDALRQLEAEVDALGPRAGDGASIETRLVEDSPSKAVLDEARDADLVVVGSRGRGGFASLLLGSVSRVVVQHSPCPVAVIRHDGA
jgi:nucleotide-binding universal stress UspA family protein